MADNKIKIGADTSSIKKSLLDLSKEVKSLGTSKISIFDKKDKEFLTAQAKSSLNSIKKQMEANREEIKKSLKEQSKVTNNVVQEFNARKRILELTRKQVELQKKAQQFQDFATMNQGGISGMLGRAKSGIGKGMSGLGLGGAMRFLGPLGLAAGVGGLAYSRASKGFDTFQGGVDDRLALRGRGVGDMALSDPGRAARAGLSSLGMRRARLQSMDVFGRGGASQQAVLQRAEFERNFGVQQGTLSNIGGQLRGNLGGKGAEKAVMAVQASLIASGITDEIGPFLETAASVLTSINENGISFSDSAMAMFARVASTGEIAPERAGRLIAGIDSSIRGSSGESNAFFQQVFGNAGIGGNTIGGIQAGIRSGGLFGANIDQSYLSEVDKASFKELGIGGRTGGKVAQSTLKTLDQLFGTEGDIKGLLGGSEDDRKLGAAKRLQRNNFIMNTFGLKNEVQAGEVNRLLKDLAQAQSPKEQAKIKKKIDDIQAGNTELGNLQEINKSTAALVDITAKEGETIRDILGEQVAPAFVQLESTMNKLDSVLSAILDFFGIETPDQAIKEGLGGKDVISQEIFGQATAGNKQKQEEFSKQLAEKFAENQSRIGELKGKGFGNLSGPERYELQRLERENSNMEMSDSGVAGLDMRKYLSSKDAMSLDSSTVSRFKDEQSSAFSAENIGSLFSSFFSDMKQAITGEKPESKKKDDQELQKQMLEIQRKAARAQEQTSRNTKNLGGLPNSTGRT